MKLKQRIFVAMSALHEARLQGLILILFIAHFFSFVLFGSVAFILHESFNRTPAAIALELLPGIMIAAGAYIPDNMLSRSAWSSIRPGLLMCIIASCCLMVWEDGGTSFLVTVAVFCAGFGLAAITIGGGREQANISPPELPSARNAKMMQSKLFGSAFGILFSAFFALSQWGNLDIRAVRVTFMILFALLVLLLLLFTSSQRMRHATAENFEATQHS